MVLGLGLLGCDLVASAPARRPQSHRGARATTAARAFWTAFQGARYEAIDSVLGRLTAAYPEQPLDHKPALADSAIATCGVCQSAAVRLNHEQLPVRFACGEGTPKLAAVGRIRDAPSPVSCRELHY